MRQILRAFAACWSSVVGLAAAQPAFLGATPYHCADDSPFSGLPFEFFALEDFEDHVFDVPGAVPNQGGVTSVVFGPDIHDSVDCDDGILDGSGLDGDSFFSYWSDITITFDPRALGAYPTHAGLVWTDGGPMAIVTFEAFTPDGQSLGELSDVHADDSNNGETGEDRFYGVIDERGIGAMRIRHTSGGIEIDHIQYGWIVAPPFCFADFNLDGGVDGSDIDAFFAAWEAGDTSADVNQDGGIDGADVDNYFTIWEAGGC